jgi:cysteinyl-tRNA synthetase
MLRLYDTATQTVRPLEMREPGTLSMYVCGPTVYGPPHLGHGRSTLVFDILRRYLEYTGITVRHVSNVTDIDDHIIDRANREQRPWQDITTKCEAVWWQSMGAINALRPTDTPHATEYVDAMVDMIRELVDNGSAYVTDDGVYLSVKTVPDYGLLAQQKLEDMLSGGGEREVFGAGNKRDPADFVLWKLSKPGEPSWPSPWGEGRPGWHSECVVMSLQLLGEHFDLHGGGQDLKFPHHENERAQAVALGKGFANHWMHHAFVVDPEGVKLSKSLGNFTNLIDLIDTMDPRSYRLLLLQSHYRSPVSVTNETVGAAERALAGLDSFARRAVAAGATAGQVDDSLATAFRERMDDDLDTASAMAIVFDAARAGNAAIDGGNLDEAAVLFATVTELCSAVGLELKSVEDVPSEVLAKAAALDEARAAKDFATADALRAELQSEGWQVETTKTGTTVRR